MASLQHAHIVQLLDYGQTDDAVYLVMELLNGGSLAKLMRRGPMPLETARRILEQVASALDYAHQRGVIHRDVKPHNILIDEEGCVHLTDFGIAKLLAETTALTQSGIAIGTPAYMSPEQWQGKPCDGRTDLYALGVVLFEMLTGRLPFTGDTPASLLYAHLCEPPPPIRSLRPRLPLGVETVVNTTLAKDPAQRYASAGDLAAAYKAALSRPILRELQVMTALPPDSVSLTQADTLSALDAVLQVEAPGPEVRLTPPARRHRALLLAAVGLLGPVIIVLFGAWSQSPPAIQIAARVASGTVTSLPMTRAAATLAQRGLLTANAVASHTHTPTATRTPTPNDPATIQAIVAATITANAIASVTKTPTGTPTSTSTPTATLRPMFPFTPTALPGAARIDAEGIAQLWVPAGCFAMGSDPLRDTAAGSDEQPQHDVCLTHSFWSDQNDVTNAAYQRFVNAGGYTLREYWSDEGWQWLQANHVTAPDNTGGFTDPGQPRVGVSWYEAQAYARWRGGRLPTEAEWEYAARGPQAPIYPWGDSYQNSRANLDDRINGGQYLGKTVPVGSFGGDQSWIGAYDMVGNIREWVADWYSGDYYQQKVKSDPQGPESGARHGVRGGSWRVNPDLARGAARSSDNPGSRSPDLGFRIVEPAAGS
jgi:formylglycine-generating enzyme required for sulfatase activity